jgi:cell division transport system permease protein
VIAHVASALRRTARIATRRPRAALWTLLALASALFVAGFAVVVAATVDRWADAHPGAGGAMVVYLGEDVDDARAAVLVGELRALRGVERAELVTAAESAKRLTRALGGDPALLAGVEPASLPASVEVSLAPGVRDVVAMSPTVRALRGAPGVAEVVVADAADSDDAPRGALRTARTVAWSGAGLFAGLALVIVLAAARIGLARSRREAEVLRLLGASPAFLAIPSALAGAVHGLVAAALAALALAWVVPWPGSLGTIELAAPPGLALAALVALGGLVGLVGGGLAGVCRVE